MQPYVQDYQLVQPIAPGQYHFTGNSVGCKRIARHVFADTDTPRSLLDIGFGQGDLGRIIKTDADTRHWTVDGIDGFRDTCCNQALFDQRWYRHVWHGLAQELPAAQLQAYDAICLFDVIEHLPVDAAKALLAHLLSSLGPTSRLLLSTPLWFWPQSQQNPDDLEEHVIAVPASSLLRLAPLMFHVDSRHLVGTFVFSRHSLGLLQHFQPTTDRGFDLQAGQRDLAAMGRQADGVLYFVQH